MTTPTRFSLESMYNDGVFQGVTVLRKYWLRATIVCAGLALIWAALIFYRFATRPFWLDQLEAQSLFEPSTPPPGFEVPAVIDDEVRYIKNDVARRHNWTMVEARELEAFIRRPTPASFITRTQTRSESLATRPKRTASSLVYERFAMGAPIERDALEVLIDALLDEAQSPYWGDRQDVASGMSYGMMLHRPCIRRIVESLVNDPHPMVAMTARQGLKSFDRRKEKDGQLLDMFIAARGY